MKNSYNFTKIRKVGTLTRKFAFALITGLFVWSGQAFAQKPAASLEQIRNGSADKPVSPAQWQNGNAGHQTAHYVEGHSIGYRALLSGLPTNGSTVTLILGYDVRHSSKNAIDFLTQYDRIQPHGQFYSQPSGTPHPLHQEIIDPTIGTSFRTNGNPDPFSDTMLIPRPIANATIVSPPGIIPLDSWKRIKQNNPAKSVMTIWGGDITSIQYVGTPANLTNAQAEQRIAISFIPSGPNAVLAWGGHIANRNEWGYDSNGVPLSAGGISGSPYHMRLIDWNLSNLGNQDRSLSASAVIAPPGCELDGPATTCSGSNDNEYSTQEDADTYNWTILTGANENTSGAYFTNTNGDNLGTTETTTTGSILVFAGSASGSYTVKLETVKNNIASTDNCTKTTTVTQVSAPSVAYNSPACDASTFSLTISNVISGATYSITDKCGDPISGVLPGSSHTPNNSSNFDFTNIPAGSGYQVRVTVNGCPSAANSCGTCPNTARQTAPSPQGQPALEKGPNLNKEMIAYPVPFSDKVTIEFKSRKAESYEINLYDMQGRLVKQLAAGNAKAGEVTKLQLDGKGMIDSMYLVRKVSKSGAETVKLLKKE